MLYRLIYLSGDRTGQRVNVATEPMTMGRDPECAVVLDDAESAACHAEIVHRGDGLFVRDLGSMNRLLVNQREVTDARLKHGDMLEVGRTRFLVQCSVQADVSRPVPVRRARRGLLRALGVAIVLAAGFQAYRIYAPAPAPEPSRPPVSIPAPAPVAAVAPVPAPVPVPAPPVPAPAPVAAVPVAPAAAASNVAVQAEIEEIRRQLADLHGAVKNLGDAPAPPSNTPLSNFRPGDPLKERTAKMLAQARADAEAGRWAEADRQLSNIQIIDSDFLEAYVQRAALMEKRGMIKKAIEQWTEVVGRSVGTPLYDRAVKERIRLGDLDRDQPDSEPVLRIDQAEVQRFPQSDEYEEMRLLTVKVNPVSAEPVDAASVRLEVTFFVRSGESAAPVAVTTQVAHVEGEWPSGRQRTLTASYLVPKGTAARGEYCGFVAGIYYRDRLQASEARPRSLLVAGFTDRGDLL